MQHPASRGFTSWLNETYTGPVCWFESFKLKKVIPSSCFKIWRKNSLVRQQQAIQIVQNKYDIEFQLLLRLFQFFFLPQKASTTPISAANLTLRLVYMYVEKNHELCFNKYPNIQMSRHFKTGMWWDYKAVHQLSDRLVLIYNKILSNETWQSVQQMACSICRQAKLPLVWTQVTIRQETCPPICLYYFWQ